MFLSAYSLLLFANVLFSQASKVPETYLEAKRREAQAWYLEEQKYIRDHSEEFDRQKKAQEEAALREMSGNLWGTLGTLVGAQPPPAAPGADAAASGQAEPVKVEKSST